MATGGVKPNGNLIKASVTQITEKLEKKPSDEGYGLANLFFVKHIATTNTYRNIDTTNTTSRHTPVDTCLDPSREGASSAAYQTLNERRSSMESGPPALAGMFTLPPEHNP
jgi:hypothetical protein